MFFYTFIKMYSSCKMVDSIFMECTEVAFFVGIVFLDLMYMDTLTLMSKYISRT